MRDSLRSPQRPDEVRAMHARLKRLGKSQIGLVLQIEIQRDLTICPGPRWQPWPDRPRA